MSSSTTTLQATLFLCALLIVNFTVGYEVYIFGFVIHSFEIFIFFEINNKIFFYVICMTHKSENNHQNLHPIVSLPKYGQLQGSIGSTAWTNRTIFQFLNVPYAESPSGSRRFKAPVPIRPWNGVRNAQKFGIQCPCFDNIEDILRKEGANIDIEDCLNMAIYSPSVRIVRR